MGGVGEGELCARSRAGRCLAFRCLSRQALTVKSGKVRSRSQRSIGSVRNAGIINQEIPVASEGQGTRDTHGVGTRDTHGVDGG